MEIRYINTDLDLVASYDLNPLAAVLEARGVFLLDVTQKEDGGWSATLETEVDHAEPEATIAAMLDVIESLEGLARDLWVGCSLREFNIGYYCGEEPSVFHNGLTHAALLRVAGVGAGLRITLYSTNFQGQAQSVDARDEPPAM